MIKGYFWDSKGELNTYFVHKVHPSTRNWKKRRKNQIRCRIVRGSVIGAALLANISLLTLGGSDPNWALGIGISLVCVLWISIVVAVNGGRFYVE